MIGQTTPGLHLHTIVRLPNDVFAPYTSIPTNLLFFDRSGPTKWVWYYEQPLPNGRKNYTKTQTMQYEEFRDCLAWWPNQEETIPCRILSPDVTICLSTKKHRSARLPDSPPALKKKIELSQVQAWRRSSMHTRSQTAKWIICSILFLTITQMFTGCSGSPGNGGITIAQSDSTPPMVSLGVGQPQGQNKTVSAAGPVTPGTSPVSLKLISKSGPLNLVVTGTDQESGIQSLQIWVNQETTSCTGTICSTTGPGLLGGPLYQSTSPQKHPGDTTSASSTLLEAMDLTKWIPQGNVSTGSSLKVTIMIYAIAINNFNEQSQTPEIDATWSEP